MTAELLIPADFARESLNEDICLSLLQQSGVDLRDTVVAAVKDMIAHTPPPGQEHRIVLAQGAPPQHGEDGRIEWLVSEPAQTAHESTDQNEAVSHYERSTYIVVKTGDTIARVIAPTPGVDGRDVQGKTVSAKPGRPAAIKVDESVIRDASGALIAQADGVLQRANNSVLVLQILEVPGYVDFSTGHIDFVGSVTVREGIRDRFVVKATGGVEVRGLIEAATIECGGSLAAQGGMAGRERGHVNVGADLIAKYLDNIQGEVRGDLEVQREAISCDLVVHGEVKMPTGTIIGGRVVSTGRVEVAALGSGACVPTEIVLGTVPRLEPSIHQLQRLIEQLTAKREKLDAEMKLMKKGARMSNADKERQTELTYEHQTVATKLAQAVAVGDVLANRVREMRTVDLTVSRKLFAGVILTVGEQSFKITSDVKGPVKVTLSPTGEVVYRRGDSDGGPLITIAELKL